MNDFLVQYADNDVMVHEWTKADSPLDAAANVLIDRGFSAMLHQSDETLIIVVCKTNWQAGVYPVSDVRARANHMVGLPIEINHPNDW
jgi:hypothetical protein